MTAFLNHPYLPTLVFFLMFGAGFALLEGLWVAIFNALSRRYSGFMVDVVIRARVRHGKKMKWIIVLAILTIIVLAFTLTPVSDIWVRSSHDWKMFSAILALLMLVIYYITVRRITRIDIQKRIYEVTFFLISIPIFVVTLILANEFYADYVSALNRLVITPTSYKMETASEERNERKLLEKFRAMRAEGGCEPIDLQEIRRENIVNNMVFVDYETPPADDAESLNLEDPSVALKGELCSDGASYFILADWGGWYSIREEALLLEPISDPEGEGE